MSHRRLVMNNLLPLVRLTAAAPAIWLAACAVQQQPAMVEQAPAPAPVLAPAPVPVPEPASGESLAPLAEPAPVEEAPPMDQMPNLLDRAAARFALPPLRETQQVQNMARYYARKDMLGQTRDRAGLYLHYFVTQAEKRNLPGELALLPYIESAYNPHALSVAGAAGICQFIKSTGRNFDMPQSALVDMRRDAVKCANAMYDYLEQNYQQFQDWHLALAAYNAGAGAVERAVRKNRAAGRPTDFDSLALPRETRNYVPTLLGLAALIKNPDFYGYTLPVLTNATAWVTVDLPADIDVDKVIDWSGVDAKTFHALNPALNKPVIPRAVHPHVVLPPDAAERFSRALAAQRDMGALSSLTTVKLGQRASTRQIASQYGMSEAQVRSLNNLVPNKLVSAGSTLVVFKTSSRQGDISAAAASNAYVATVPVAVPRQIHIHRGDTLPKLAARTGIAQAVLRKGNPALAAKRLRRGVITVTLPIQIAEKTSPAQLMAPEPQPKTGARPRHQKRNTHRA